MSKLVSTLSLVVTTILILYFPQEAVATPLQVKGMVFEDRNGNGTRDPGEPGLPGILVSNQQEVVRTDQQGRFTLTLVPGRAVYVQQPSTHRVPLNLLNLPQFSYLYEPTGSPPLKYGGLPATGTPEPKDLEFPLLPLPGAPQQQAETNTEVVAAVFGDPQPQHHLDLDYLRDDALPDLQASGVDFALVLGDLVYDDLSLFPRYNQIMAQIGVPLWNVIGNHDLDYDAGGNRHARDTYKRHYGPTYYSFEYGDTVFVAFDNIDYQGIGENGVPKYRGLIGEQQLRWFENLLQEIPEDRLIVLAMHIPLFVWDGQMAVANTEDREQLLALLQGRKALVLAGHIHMVYHYLLGEEVGWSDTDPLHQVIASTLSGSWWMGPEDERGIPISTQRDGVPNGFHLFRFAEGSYTERYQGLNASPEFQIRIEVPEGLIDLQDPDRPLQDWIIANVFSGAADHRVVVSVNGEVEVEMERFTDSSPYFVELLQRFPSSFGPSQALPTNHLWRSPRPAVLQEPGLHTIEVRSLDRYGQTHSSWKAVEVR